MVLPKEDSGFPRGPYAFCLFFPVRSAADFDRSVSALLDFFFGDALISREQRSAILKPGFAFLLDIL